MRILKAVKVEKHFVVHFGVEMVGYMAGIITVGRLKVCSRSTAISVLGSVPTI